MSGPATGSPGIPQHRFKAGVDYWITPKWKFGADLVAASDQVFFGDEGNDVPTLDGYATVDLHTSYDVTDHIQVYGLVDNVFDSRYGLFGNYFNLELANKRARPAACRTTSSPTPRRSRPPRRLRPTAA